MGLTSATGIVFNIQRFSIHDGPGIRTTMFFKGCPLQCAWCHNPESQSGGPSLVFSPNRCIRCAACVAACPYHAVQIGDDLPVTSAACRACGACVDVCFAEAREMAGREMSVAEVMAEVERDIAFYDQSGGGMTASGGEPLQQPAFLLEMLRACRTQEIHTVLDTCGYAPWDVLDAVRPYVDLFLYDVKLVDAGRHREFTGASNEPILDNLKALSQAGHRIIIRVPVIPGINDDEDNIRATAALAASLPCLERVELLPYHALAADKYPRLGLPYRLPDVRPPSATRMEELQALVRAYGVQVR